MHRRRNSSKRVKSNNIESCCRTKKKKTINIYLLIVEQHQKQTPELFVYVCKKVIGGDFKVILLATSSLSLLWGLKPCFHSGILLLLKVSKLCKLSTVSFWTDNNLMKTSLSFFFSFLVFFSLSLLAWDISL